MPHTRKPKPPDASHVEHRPAPPKQQQLDLSLAIPGMDPPLPKPRRPDKLSKYARIPIP